MVTTTQDFRKALGHGWVDAHCHLADPRLDQSRSQVLDQARAAGFSAFLQAGIDPIDWERQLALQKTEPGILPVFGLHPYTAHTLFVEGKLEDAEVALDQLARLLRHCPLLGETGIDLRPQFQESEGFQIEMFEAQLTLAELAQKPVLLHLVRGFETAERIFTIRGAPKYGGFVHAFTGGQKEAHFYAENGLLMSVGASIFHPKSEKLRQAVKALDMKHFLVESDAPDQAAFDAPAGELNSPLVVLRAAAEIGRLKGMTAAEVLDRSKENLQRLFPSPQTGATAARSE